MVPRTSASHSASDQPLWAGWHRSSRCSSDACVEIRVTPADVQVRGSQRPDAGALSFDHEEWRAFVAGVRNGEFDV
jgi:hypothetical protein